MAALNPVPDETARKIASLILQRLSEVGQNEVARTLGTSDATVSRLKADIPQLSGLIAKCGLKVVPMGYRCVEPKKMDALLTLAGLQIDQLRQRPELVWEDAE